MCSLRDRYARLQAISPTLHLQRFFEEARQRLAPIPRDRAFKAVARDLYGNSISAAEIRPIALFRQLLEDGLRSVRSRSVLLDRLANIPASGADAVAIIRLLALERQWLKLPPIRLGDVRAHVVRLACDIALNAAEGEAALRVACQAIEVLASIDAAVFVRRSADALRTNPTEQVGSTILAELLRLLMGPDREDGGGTRGIDGALADLSALTSAHPPLNALRSTVQSLQLLTQSQQSTESPWNARALLEHAYETQAQRHQLVVEGALTVLSALSNHELWTADRRASVLKPVLDEWDLVQSFLDRWVLPLLLQARPALSPLAETLDVDQRFHRRVAQWSGRQPFAELYRVRDLITERLGEQRDLPQPLALREVFDEVTWWTDAFLRLAEPGWTDDAAGPSRHVDAWLRRALSDRPSNVARVVDDALAEARVRGFDFDHEMEIPNGVLVECSQTALRAALVQLIQNATDTHRAVLEGERHQVIIQFSHEETGDNVAIEVRNTGSVPVVGEPTESGLRRARDALAEFGATIEIRRPFEPWTFEVVIHVQRNNGGSGQ